MTAILDQPTKPPQVIDLAKRSHFELRCPCGKLHLPHTRDPILCPCGRELVNQWGEE